MKQHGGRWAVRERWKGGLLALGVGLLLVALAAARPQIVRADGGVWPSPTPTFGPSPTPGGFVPFVATPTVPVFVMPEITVEPTVIAIVTIQPTEITIVPTPIVNQTSSRALCWPFALGFILILILGSIALIGRRV